MWINLLWLQGDLPCTGCLSSSCRVLTAPNGTISDGLNVNYLNNAGCQWIIAPSSAILVTISFTELNTEFKSDYVQLYQCTDASCLSWKELANLSGTSSKMLNFTSTTGILMVNFTSDSDVTYSGFVAFWTSEIGEKPPTPVSDSEYAQPWLVFIALEVLMLCMCA